MPADPPDTLPETLLTLPQSSLWLSESAPDENDVHNSASWYILRAYVYGTLLIALGFVVAMGLSWPNRSSLEPTFTLMVINVLCFTSGINWGVSLRYAAVTQRMPAFHILWAPLPAYLAWPCILLPTHWALLALMVLFIWAYRVEYTMWFSTSLAPWLRMRRHFIIGIVTLCLTGAAISWLALPS